MSPAEPRRRLPSLADLAGLVAWVYLYLVALLIGLVVLVMVSTGWRPVVVTGASMTPALRLGDVLLVEEPAGLVGQRTIITYRVPGGDALVTHRVHEALAEEGRYVTKGDANADPDTDPVPAERVVGVGRMVVPYVGLPVVWAGQGNWAPVAALAVLTAAAVGVAVRSRRRSPRIAENADGAVAGRAVARVRGLVAVLVLGQIAVTARSLTDVVGPGLPVGLVLGGAVAVLLGTNLAASLIRRRPGADHHRLAMAELVVDTALVVVLGSVTGGSGIGWVLIVLPIVEAAARFGLTGALMHWLVLSAVTLSGGLWSASRSGASSTDLVGGLEQTVDQLAVLLLVAVPGAYLAEQLLRDVSDQRRATEAAVERGRLLEQVTAGGHRVNQLQGDLFETLQSAVIGLGFDAVDVVVWPAVGRWRHLVAAGEKGAPLPSPGAAGSGLRADDLRHAEVVVAPSDPEVSEREALAAAGYGVLARVTLSRADDQLVVLRAARRRSTTAAATFEALRLLCAQAAVALQNKELLATLEGLHDEMARQATHDALTGLPNRVRFVAAVQQALTSVGESETVPAVLFLDLNGFKDVNDRLGHDAGDDLLCQVADRIRRRVGRSGLVARLGGDEFTVLVHEVRSVSDAQAAASAVHAELVDPFVLPRGPVRVGTSIGIALAERGIDDSELLRRADVAMYTAKEAGGATRTAVFDPGMDEQSQRRGRLISELQRAFDNGELELAFQPLVEVASGDIVGAEALLRWRHRELGPIPPGDVLELAQAAGRLSQLNAWILTTALAGVASCALDDEQTFAVAVNVSPTELAAEWLVPHISDALTLTGVAPERLVIEVSERVVADDSTAADAAAVAEMGVALALDDFGEGRTALAHLRGLPIDQLKLDQVLVHHALGSEADRTILDSVVGLAHELGFTVVAEGIETEDHLRVAAGSGADLIQGYHLHRPMPINQLRSLLWAGPSRSEVRAPYPGGVG